MDRISLLAAAFKDVPLTCGQLRLRPLTAGTMMLLMESGNVLFAPSDAEITEAMHMQAVFEFLYVHAAPEDEVITAAEAPADLRRHARRLAMGVSFEDLAEFSERFQKLYTRLLAATAEVVPEKPEGKPAGETPLPIGSPSSSIPSAAMGTPHGSITSSGGCPSSALSNTSTRRTSLTESAPAGRSRVWEEQPESQEESPEVIPLP